MRRIAVIRKCKAGDKEPGKPWCLYTHDGSKLLGRHPSKEKAEAQEAAIQISKHSVKGLLRRAIFLINNG